MDCECKLCDLQGRDVRHRQAGNDMAYHRKILRLAAAEAQGYARNDMPLVRHFPKECGQKYTLLMSHCVCALIGTRVPSSKLKSLSLIHYHVRVHMHLTQMLKSVSNLQYARWECVFLLPCVIC